MKAVRRQNVTGVFSWIGSDGWSARNLVSDGNEAEVEGTLSVQPQANPVIGFEDYFLNLTVINNKRNPWFVGEYFARKTPITFRMVPNYPNSKHASLLFHVLQNSGKIISNVNIPTHRTRRTIRTTRRCARPRRSF